MNWFGFVIGKLLHWWLKSDANKATGTFGDWLKRNRRSLPVRAAIATGLFYLWTLKPDMMTWVIRKLATQLSNEGMIGIVREAGISVTVPLNIVTAGGFGYVIDSLLDKACAKFPALREYIPVVNGNTVVLNASDIPLTRPQRTPRDGDAGKADEAGAGH